MYSRIPINPASIARVSPALAVTRVILKYTISPTAGVPAMVTAALLADR